MNRLKIAKNWYIWLVALLFLMQLVAMTAWGERSFVAIHDNLDLFVAHNAMMKQADLLFKQDALAPMLGGVSRDLLGSEFSLYNILYFFFSPYTAYVMAYVLKLLIGFWGSLLLAKEVYGKDYGKYKALFWLIGAGYAMIPVFPAYGIAFASLPLCLVILRRIYVKPRLLWYGLLFLYPWLSYFSYFGFFLSGYLVCFVIIDWIRKRRFSPSFALTVPILAAGYVVWEYRLFSQMLFSDTVTIRSTMVNTDLSVGQVFDTVLEVLVDPGFHAEDSHGYFILPICLIVLVAVNTAYLRRGEKKKIWSEPMNLVFFLILFNCIVYGCYYYKPFRDLFETLVPVLTGFQFNRTIYFNPLLWHILFFLVLKAAVDFAGEYNRKKENGANRAESTKSVEHAGNTESAECAQYAGNPGYTAASVIAVIGTLICMFAPQVYNDFYSNCYHHAYELIKGQESSQLSYGEFYSEELFDRIKEEIGYEGEWAVAYGMHPGVLQYNGIATLDGYLGMYSQEYKEAFRKVIAPALEKSEEFQNTYDIWGARAYVYSGAGENTYEPVRNLELSDQNLYIDPAAFQSLGGTWIFSRIALANADELGLGLEGEYRDESSPYTIYVYRN